MEIEIKISGPGLVVNFPTALIYKALIEAGYKVHLPNFAGQFTGIFAGQFSGIESNDCWHKEVLKNSEHLKKIFEETKPNAILQVTPMPWGG